MKAFCFSLLSLAAIGCWAETHDHDETIIQSCTRTANSYPYSRDRLDFEAYGNLFTKDAAFELLGDRAEGREAIVEALKARGGEATTRHFSNVVHMEVTGDNTAQGVSYLVLYRASAEAMNTGKNTVSGPFIVAEYHDRFVFADNRCRIQERVVKIIFQGS